MIFAQHAVGTASFSVVTVAPILSIFHAWIHQ